MAGSGLGPKAKMAWGTVLMFQAMNKLKGDTMATI
jgi:hypothetical protein